MPKKGKESLYVFNGARRRGYLCGYKFKNTGVHLMISLKFCTLIFARCLPARRAATRVSFSPSPPGPSYLRLVFLAITVWLGAAGAAFAGDPSYEFWPEVDLWLRLSPAWRLSMFVPLSKNIETDYREGNLILQADYAWGKGSRLYKARLLDEGRAREMNTWMVRGGYLGGRSLDDHGQNYRENTMFLELHNRTPLKGDVLLSNRLRTDFRWLGDDPDFSYRLRYRLMVEKEFEVGRSSIVPYVNIEPYYDSRYGIVNRVRLIGGVTGSWSPRYALEGNITYQHDSRSSVTNLYALNVILHLYFETGGAR
jgi:hypothetical protein